MAQEDRERWDARYRGSGHASGVPMAALVELSRWLPDRGRALDVAGGAGVNAVWLARRGLEVTVADISAVGLERAAQRAEAQGVELIAVEVDLEEESLPAGPWALVLCCNYLQRDLLERAAPELGEGGRVVWVHPTVVNLERHERPGRRFLLEPGEARTLAEAAGLRVRWAEESWVGEGAEARHLSRLVAERC